MTNARGKATAILLVTQVLFMVLFGLFVDYNSTAGPTDLNATTVKNEDSHTLEDFYPMYQDIHVMMLIGFGFLMTFLKRHGFGSVGFNFLLTCFVIEWSTLVNGWFQAIGNNSAVIKVDVRSLMDADFAVATVLISFGAVLGKTSPVQLLLMATLEVVFYNISLYVGSSVLKAIDVGGSIFIHAFGAYFGMAVARVLYRKKQTESDKEGSVYHSDIFAMIGTLFLWLYWPSFNAAPAMGNERHRAVINTIFSLSSCTVVTFALSAVLDKKNKLEMVHIQNATLAGGVIMGASADLIVHPFGSMIAGAVAGIVSTLGYKYLQPLLQDKMKLHDTCGVNNLHGMPGILGAIVSAIACAVATRENYKDSYNILFPDPDNRTSVEQGGYQIAALAVALGISLVAGTVTGFILKWNIWDNLTDTEYFEDDIFWDAIEEIEHASPQVEPQISSIAASRSKQKKAEKEEAHQSPA